jgi:hypothetical protein
MVPGLTEREEKAVTARQLEWLGDSLLGPSTPAPSHRDHPMPG